MYKLKRKQANLYIFFNISNCTVLLFSSKSGFGSWTSVADPNPAPDPRVLGLLDPDPDPSRSLSKNSKKNLDFHCCATSFGLFIFEK
jgi:hypothetical protein